MKSIDEQETLKCLKRVQVAFSFIYVASCLLGCLIQCISVTEIYLSYQVLTRLSLFLPNELRSPAFTVCFRYVDIVNLTRYSEMYNVPKSSILDDATVRSIQNNITLGAIFNLSPGGTNHQLIDHSKKLIQSCAIRSPNGYTMHFINSSKCSESVFSIERFLIQEYLCYKCILQKEYIAFGRKNSSLDDSIANEDPDNGLKYEFKRLALSTIYPSVFYIIQLSLEEGHFGRADRMRTVIHSAGDLPFVSLSLSPILYRKALALYPKNIQRYLRSLNQTDNSSDSRIRFELRDMFNHIAARFARVQIRRLPAPYTSNCRPRYLRNSCISNCTFVSTLKKLNKIPFQNLFTERGAVEFGAMKLVSNADVKTVATNNLMKQILRQCQARCTADSCYSDYTITSPEATLTGNKRLISFEIGCPYEPFIVNHAVPSVQFNDYLLQFLSLIGFWLGLSVREINLAAYFIHFAKLYKSLTHRGVNKIAPIANEASKSGATVYCVKTRKLFTEKIHRQFFDALALATNGGIVLNRSCSRGDHLNPMRIKKRFFT